MSGANGTVEKKWLNPVEALTQFTPSLDMHQPAEGREQPKRRDLRSARYGFRVGNVGLLLAPEKLSEVVSDALVHPIPTTPVWFSGLINLRGNLVPVFDLGRLLGVDEKQGKKKAVLVVDRGDKAVGIPIKGLPETIPPVERLQQLPPLPAILRDHVRMAYMHQRTIWLEFDFEGLFKAIGAEMPRR